MISFFVLIVQLWGKVVNALRKRFWHKYALLYLKVHNVQYDETMPPHFFGGGKLWIEKGGNVSLGKDFVCRSSPLYCIDCGLKSKIVVKKNATLIIGNFSGISNTVIQCHKYISIGNYVNIGAGSLIMDSNFHSTDWKQRIDRKEDVKNARVKSVVIGDYVFIGSRSIIMKGVSIGEKSMICAGSVVTCDIPPMELWGGNPAKFIKQLR